MKIVYIVGGNGFARECYYNLLGMIKADKEIVFGGFMGHGGYGHTVNYFDLQNYYVGEVSEHEFKDDEYVVIGAGYPELRSKIYNELKERHIQFFTLYAAQGLLPSVDIGESNIFIAPMTMSCNIKIGNNNVFNGGVIVGHDCEIGDCNFFGPRSQVLGDVKIGSYNTIGANAILLPHCRVGNNNKIAPLSAIYKGCRNNSYMAGNPAVKVGDVE